MFWIKSYKYKLFLLNQFNMLDSWKSFLNVINFLTKLLSQEIDICITWGKKKHFKDYFQANISFQKSFFKESYFIGLIVYQKSYYYYFVIFKVMLSTSWTSTSIFLMKNFNFMVGFIASVLLFKSSKAFFYSYCGHFDHQKLTWPSKINIYLFKTKPDIKCKKILLG